LVISTDSVLIVSDFSIYWLCSYQAQRGWPTSR